MFWKTKVFLKPISFQFIFFYTKTNYKKHVGATITALIYWSRLHLKKQIFLFCYWLSLYWLLKISIHILYFDLPSSLTLIMYLRILSLALPDRQTNMVDLTNGLLYRRPTTVPDVPSTPSVASTPSSAPDASLTLPTSPTIAPAHVCSTHTTFHPRSIARNCHNPSTVKSPVVYRKDPAPSESQTSFQGGKQWAELSTTIFLASN